MSTKLEKLAEKKQKADAASKKASQEYSRELRKVRYQEKKAAEKKQNDELIEKGKLYESLPSDVQTLQVSLASITEERDALAVDSNRYYDACDFMKTIKYKDGRTVYDDFLEKFGYPDETEDAD